MFKAICRFAQPVDLHNLPVASLCSQPAQSGDTCLKYTYKKLTPYVFFLKTTVDFEENGRF